MHVGLHDHGEKGPVDAPASLQEAGKKLPWRSFGMASSTSPAGRGEQPGPVPVALGGPVSVRS